MERALNHKNTHVQQEVDSLLQKKQSGAHEFCGQKSGSKELLQTGEETGHSRKVKSRKRNANEKLQQAREKNGMPEERFSVCAFRFCCMFGRIEFLCVRSDEICANMNKSLWFMS
jgi:hypothetical protein